MKKTLSVLFLAISTLLFTRSAMANGPEKGVERGTLYSQLSRAVIRLEYRVEIQSEDSSQISETNKPAGTGFFVRHGRDMYVVTARHVAQKRHALHARVQTKNRVTGEMEVIELRLPRDRWVSHPSEGDQDTQYVDVTAMKLPLIKDRGIKYFGYDYEDSEGKEINQLPDKDPEPPASILIFGFPADIGFDLLEQRPFTRLGVVAMCSGKEFMRMRDTGKFLDERTCIVDVRIFGGNSGGPVINQPHAIIDPEIRLLGLITGTNRKMDYAVMVPVSRIRETLEAAKDQSLDGFSCWFLLD